MPIITSLLKTGDFSFSKNIQITWSLSKDIATLTVPKSDGKDQAVKVLEIEGSAISNDDSCGYCFLLNGMSSLISSVTSPQAVIPLTSDKVVRFVQQ